MNLAINCCLSNCHVIFSCSFLTSHRLSPCRVDTVSSLRIWTHGALSTISWRRHSSNGNYRIVTPLGIMKRPFWVLSDDPYGSYQATLPGPIRRPFWVFNQAILLGSLSGGPFGLFQTSCSCNFVT